MNSIQSDNFKVHSVDVTSSEITIIWNKISCNVQNYTIYVNSNKIKCVSSRQFFYTISDLKPQTEYKIQLKVTFENGNKGYSAIKVKTGADEAIVDVTRAPYSIETDSVDICTSSLQQAIDDCPKGGEVLIPKGVTIYTGAIDLKSNMTLRVDGTLIGSEDPDDYLYRRESEKRCDYVNQDGLVLSRYEGWELFCFRSLINVGRIKVKNRSAIVSHDVRICGTGTIIGGGSVLGNRMKEKFSDVDKYPMYVSDGVAGRRSRAKLISIVQSKNVTLTGLTLRKPSCWTVHLLYSNTVNVNNLKIDSLGIDNGDGIDPDSCKNINIFDVSFKTQIARTS